MHLICEVQVVSVLITNCNHKLSSRWSHINVVTSGCGAKQAFQRQNETELDGLDVYRRQGADKRSMVTTWVKESWEDIPADMVKKSFLKRLQTTPPTRGGAVTVVWQILSTPHAPSNGGLIIVFWASRPCGSAGWLAILLIKVSIVETNPGPTTTRKQVWICDICHRQIQGRNYTECTAWYTVDHVLTIRRPGLCR